MTIKKVYNIGDTVWVAGITHSKFTQGTVIHKLTIPEIEGTHYIISIPTHIEPLLELRTWETISQDENGPIGLFREVMGHMPSTNRLISKTGYYQYNGEDKEPTDEEIVAALNKSQKTAEHPPLILNQRKRRYGRRKKIQ